jgi:hypothetical protein
MPGNPVPNLHIVYLPCNLQNRNGVETMTHKAKQRGILSLKNRIHQQVEQEPHIQQIRHPEAPQLPDPKPEPPETENADPKGRRVYPYGLGKLCPCERTYNTVFRGMRGSLEARSCRRCGLDYLLSSAPSTNPPENE